MPGNFKKSDFYQISDCLLLRSWSDATSSSLSPDVTSSLSCPFDYCADISPSGSVSMESSYWVLPN